MIDRNLLLPGSEQSIFDAWSRTPPAGHTPSPSIRVLLEALCEARRTINRITIRMERAESEVEDWRTAQAAGHPLIEPSERDCPSCGQPLTVVGGCNSADGVRAVWSAKRRPRALAEHCETCGGDADWRER